MSQTPFTHNELTRIYELNVQLLERWRQILGIVDAFLDQSLDW